MPGSTASTVPESEWQTPQASTRSRTCPAGGSVSGRSVRVKTPGRVTSTALYLVLIMFTCEKCCITPFRMLSSKQSDFYRAEGLNENSPFGGVLKFADGSAEEKQSSALAGC